MKIVSFRSNSGYLVFIFCFFRSNGLHQRLLLVVISVGFSLIQSNKHLFEDKEFSSSFVSQLIQYCMLPYNFSNSNVILAILQTFERLILGFSLEQIDRTSILTLAIFFINYTISSAILFASLSLFIVCMYTGRRIFFNVYLLRLCYTNTKWDC